MQLPSLSSLGERLTDTFKRFPLSIGAAMVAADYLVRIAHNEQIWEANGPYHYYWNIIMSCYLGMLLFTAIALFVERKQLSYLFKLLLNIAGIALVVIYYYRLPDHFVAISVLRFFLYSIALHLSIAFVPYIGEGSSNGFWQYNKIVFIRILTAALYTTVLYLGLALAILAVQELFKVHINRHLYADLWIVLVTVFQTWFFLAGLPKDFIALESSEDYPKGLKIFTQYVLIPLISIYLVILYAYMFKIIFTAQWPVGWVSYLVLGFSIAGILSLLLIYPVRNDENNKWILIFSRFFYLALFPLVILLFLAISRRVRDYGITEHRYFILALALWLLFIAAYFLLSKAKNIKTIPITLCLIALLSSFGPWGAFNISLHSQQRRFVTLLQKNGMLVNGKIVKPTKAIPFEEKKQLCSSLEYIVDIHGYKLLQPYFTQNLDSLMKSNDNDRYYTNTDDIYSLMGIKHVYEYQTADDDVQQSSYLNYSADVNNAATDVTGYDYLITAYEPSTSSSDSTCSSYMMGNNSISVCYTPDTKLLSIAGANTTLRFDVQALMNKLNKEESSSYYSFKQEDMTLTGDNDKLGAKLFFTTLDGTKDENGISINNITVNILLKLK